LLADARRELENRLMTILGLGSALVLAAASSLASGQPAPKTGLEEGAEAPRTDHAVGFYDPDLQRVVLIGAPGDPAHGVRDRAWSWNGTRWELLTDQGPTGRVNAGAAYDARGGRAIVAGGARKAAAGVAWEVVGDSWQGDRRGWRPLAGIAPRDHHSLVDVGGGSVLMFGGIPADRSGKWPTDTWELDGDVWKPVATEGPPGRGRTALAYDSKRRRVVLFGGVSASHGPNQSQTFFDDTWHWDGAGWRQVAQGGPRGRYAHGMVFDERAGVVLLYGGAAAHRDGQLSDMWQWDGERWTEIPLRGPTPGHRYQPVMVYDRARHRTVLYGGIGAPSDTWEWDGQRWRQVSP